MMMMMMMMRNPTITLTILILKTVTMMIPGKVICRILGKYPAASKAFS